MCFFAAGRHDSGPPQIAKQFAAFRLNRLQIFAYLVIFGH
jgi:hypothetical protein